MCGNRRADSDAGVGNLQHGLVVTPIRLDENLATLRCEIERVLQQILDDAAKFLFVERAKGIPSSAAEVQRDMPLGSQWTVHFDHRIGQHIQAAQLEIELRLVLQAGDLEQALDQLLQALCAGFE